eukprot:6492713-Amphidinium_carterae.3
MNNMMVHKNKSNCEVTESGMYIHVRVGSRSQFGDWRQVLLRHPLQAAMHDQSTITILSWRDLKDDFNQMSVATIVMPRAIACRHCGNHFKAASFRVMRLRGCSSQSTIDATSCTFNISDAVRLEVISQERVHSAADTMVMLNGVEVITKRQKNQQW